MHIQELIDDDFLKITDLENIFKIYKDSKNNYKYNLNSTLYLDIDSSCIKEKILDHDAHWPLISYYIYNTTRLYWVLLKINDVKLQDVFKIKHAGDKIKYIDMSLVNLLVDKINDYEEDDEDED